MAVDLAFVSLIVALTTRKYALAFSAPLIQLGLLIFLLCCVGQMHLAVDLIHPEPDTMTGVGWVMLFISNVIMVFLAVEHRRADRAHTPIRDTAGLWQDAPKVSRRKPKIREVN